MVDAKLEVALAGFMARLMPDKLYVVFDRHATHFGGDRTYYAGDGVWTDDLVKAKFYETRSSAAKAFDEVDCDKVMRDRLTVEPCYFPWRP